MRGEGGGEAEGEGEGEGEGGGEGRRRVRWPSSANRECTRLAEFEILEELAFSSELKRMGVLVRARETGQVACRPYLLWLYLLWPGGLPEATTRCARGGEPVCYS